MLDTNATEACFLFVVVVRYLIMKVEIKDKTKEISVALRAAGYNVDSISVETILNIVDFIRENKKDTTIKDVVQIQEMVKSLFED